MARQFAQVHQRIWADPEWRALGSDAQLLYFLLLSQPSLNLAGVMPLQLRKWAACVADWDAPAVDMALTQLADARFVVVDVDTEEVLIRSFIRNDGGFKTPNTLKSATTQAVAVQSPAIRHALWIELGRLPELQGQKADEGQALIDAARVALNPSPNPSPKGSRNPSANPSAKGSTQPIAQPMAEPIVSVSGSVVTSPEYSSEKFGGVSYVSSAPAATPPLYPDRCEVHGNEATPPPCGRCADARKAAAVKPFLYAVLDRQPCLVHAESDVTHCRGCAADRKAAS